MKTVDAFSFKNKKVLVRVDFNVPLNAEFEITDDTRIQAAIPTIKKILSDGGAVILMSHLGRPKDGPTAKYSLQHTIARTAQLLNTDVDFVSDCISPEAFTKSSNLGFGKVLILENLRFYKEEEKGDETFAEKLAKHGEYYVNDAFGTAHRAHASTAVIAKFFPQSKCFGYVMANEITSINKVLLEGVKPVAAIIGGAKVSDKIVMIERLMDKVNHIIIGGGMAFTFIKALGGEIGNSLCELDKLDLAKDLMKLAKERGIVLHLPVDAIIADQFSNEAKQKEVDINAIPDGWMGLDIGAKSRAMYDQVIQQCKTILWNGPMGVFEMSSFEQGTKAVALSIASATRSGAFSLIGGGDSVAAINKYELANEVSYVSTGGGALLEYIEQGTLPGIEAINN
jgi:phosphoglycerate kinase